MPIAHLPGTDIHYEILGSGEPLLLVAGLGGAASYSRVEPELFNQIILDFTAARPITRAAAFPQTTESSHVSL